MHNKTGLNKEICSYETISNNYEGFKYEGNYNQCYLFNSEDFNTNMNCNLFFLSLITYLLPSMNSDSCRYVVEQFCTEHLQLHE